MRATMIAPATYVRTFAALGVLVTLIAGDACMAIPREPGCGAPETTYITPLKPPYDSYFPVRSEYGIATGGISRDEFNERPEFLGCYAIAYPKLSVGEIVPVHPAIYRVQAIGPGASFRRVRSDQLPPGVELEIDCCEEPLDFCSYAVPVGGAGSFATERFINEQRPETTTVRIKEIAFEGRDAPAAGVEFWSTSDEKRRTKTACTGDVITEGEWMLEVVKIVPPNPKTRVIGWVELKVDRAPQSGE